MNLLYFLRHVRWTMPIANYIPHRFHRHPKVHQRNRCPGQSVIPAYLCVAADLAAAAVNDVCTGTGMAAVQRQLGGVGVVGQAGVMVCVSGQLQGKGAVFAGLHRDGQVGHTALDALQRCFAASCFFFSLSLS